MASIYTVVILALSTGARKNEILNLKWQDIDLTRSLVTLHETKNGEHRSLPIKGYANTLNITTALLHNDVHQEFID